MALTEKTIKSLKPPEAGNYIRFDGEVRGFGARITAAGVISFIIDYRTQHGRQRRYTIGRYPEWSVMAARAEAQELRVRISKGDDPLQHREAVRKEVTVLELSRDYLDRHARPHKRPSSLRNDEQMLNGIVIPKLGNLPVSAVTRRDLESLHHSLKGTPYRANRVLSLISKMFGLALQWKMRADNPAHGIPRFQEDRREAWMTAEQLGALETAIDAYASQDAADALRLLILTGSREGEVLNAEWDQFDLERGVWTKPSHHTKQKRIEHVPLSPPVVAVLERRMKRKKGPYVFPGADRESRVTLRRPWVQVCKAAGLVTKQELQGKRRKIVRFRPIFRIHDLRHTFASHLVSSGQSLHIVGKLLGHTQPQTTNRYAHLSDSALRSAVQQFAGIAGLGRPAKKKARAVSA
ncbi:MAG: tyrosine-type recombinase/integrase [Terriglobales bacterium]